MESRLAFAKGYDWKITVRKLLARAGALLLSIVLGALLTAAEDPQVWSIILGQAKVQLFGIVITAAGLAGGAAAFNNWRKNRRR
jgi:hypothetical protein